MKKAILAVVTSGLLLLTSNAFAADAPAPASAPIKIGVIDLQQIMKNSTQIVAVNAQLTKEFQPRQQKIIDAQKAFQAESDQLSRNSTTMTDADRSKLQDQIITDRSNVQGMMLSFQRDVNAAQNEALQKFMAQLNTVVSTVAKAGGFDLVLQRAGVPYVNTNLDITKQVLDQLNKK